MTDHSIGPDGGASIANALAGLTSIISEQSQQLRALSADVLALRSENRQLGQLVIDLRDKVRPGIKETRDERRQRLEMAAIREISITGPSVKAIAEKLDVTERTLYRWPLFRRALDLAIAQSQAGRTKSSTDAADWEGED